ncbi:MAG: type II toxin-antitoxin system prevent-host-death family antitoxin [Actinobacteria bacterium]|nr:type II toxin-antitoxin system prevent-host-death family antitoxin [Actinomycetota bacterium]
MGKNIGIRELRQQASAVIRRVLDGESIEVTNHGHPVARIVPIRPGEMDRLVLEGRASEASGDLLELGVELGLPATTRGLTLPSDALAELRAGER